MARLSSATNLEAAISLRSRYHSKAAADSNLASSWNSTVLLVMLESGRKLFPHLFPRDHLRFSRVYVRNPAGDLFLPGLLGPFLHSTVEAGEQGISQRRPLLFGKGKCLLEQVKSLLRHELIIPLPRPPDRGYFRRSQGRRTISQIPGSSRNIVPSSGLLPLCSGGACHAVPPK